MQRLLISVLQITFCGLVVALIAMTPLTAQDNSSEENSTDQPQRIYVCNQGSATLTVIDTSTNEIVDHIDLQELGFSANAKPHHTIAEPDGSYWYVTLIGENRVLKFNRQNELVGEAQIEVPGLLSLHPTRDLLLVGRSMSAVNPPQSLAIIRRSDMTLLEEVDTFFARPHALATTPDGNWIYIASLAGNQILSMNTKTMDTELTTLGGDAQAFVNFAISPNGNTMIVTGQLSGQVLLFDISNPASPTLTDSVAVNAQPWHPLFSSDGEHAYFGNKGAHTVTVLDMQSNSVEAVIKGDGLAEPHGSAISADGKYLYISNNNRKGSYKSVGVASTGDPNGTITIINTDTYEIEKVIEVDAYPSGIGTRARW